MPAPRATGVARRGNVILLVWVVFLADLFVGAGLLLSTRAALQTAGIAMVLAAALGMVGLTLAYYVQQRRRARDPSTGGTESRR